MSDQRSFSHTLGALETTRETLASMFEAAPGWEWAQRPRKGKGATLAAGGIVAHSLQLAEPSLAITIAQGGSDARRGRKCRPVAYDRNGQRHVFEDGSGGRIGSTDADDWVSATVHHLAPGDLREADVAFVGIEREIQADDEPD